tara:strand:+ start:730 stop:1767 length:1038 start_codon:yes stop_codon:yes gene_type:complete
MVLESKTPLFEEELRGRHAKQRDPKAVKLIKDAYRASQKLPQAIVKVSSWGKSRGRIAAHLDYISRHGDYPLETPEGDLIQSKEEQKELLDKWFIDASTRKGARHSAHIILSAPKGSDPKATKEAVRATARKFFEGKHDYVFAYHHKSVNHKADENTEHPHAHLVIKARGFEGQQLRLGKKELFSLRQNFAEELRARGIMVDASYRNQRGKGTKGQNQTVINTRKRIGELEIDKSLIKEVVEEIKQELKVGSNSKPKPWEEKQHASAIRMKKQYKDLANELKKSDDVKMKSISESIDQFAENFPVPKTLRQQLKEHLIKSNQIKKDDKQTSSSKNKPEIDNDLER